ncbi:MAG: DUF433 domain-containing protein [Terriglobales bacterium]
MSAEPVVTGTRIRAQTIADWMESGCSIKRLFFRTVEFLEQRPHRKHETAPTDVQNVCRPWLFQTVPGSYQFAVAIEDVAQRTMFGPQISPPRPILACSEHEAKRIKLPFRAGFLRRSPVLSMPRGAVHFAGLL